MPLIRFVKPLYERFAQRLSLSRAYRATLTNLLHSEDIDSLRRFLLSQLGVTSSLPTEVGVPSEHTPHPVLWARAQRDYFQFFGTFGQALRSREVYHDIFDTTEVIAEPARPGSRLPRAIAIERQVLPALPKGPKRGALNEATLSGSPGGRGRRQLDPSTLAFCAAVSGKSVAVIGPSPSKDMTPETLGTFDVVALPKLHDGLWLSGGLELRPEQTVVTYLNHVTVERLRSRTERSERVWDFARVKSSADIGPVEQGFFATTDDVARVGVMRSPDDLLDNDYGPFMGTAMLYDLLLSHPSRLYLTGFSFYVQEGAAFQGNYDSIRHSEEQLLLSLRLHGAFSNFLFVKNLFTFGLIDADSEVSAILRLSAEEYASKLDQRFAGVLGLPES